MVSVAGAAFLDTYTLVCRFGAATPVRATYVAATLLLCESPATGTTGSVPLEVSNNNQDYTADAVPFLYQGTDERTRPLAFWG